MTETHTCEMTVWLPGPPATEYSGPHYCGKAARIYARPWFGNQQLSYEKWLCDEHAFIHGVAIPGLTEGNTSRSE